MAPKIPIRRQRADDRDPDAVNGTQANSLPTLVPAATANFLQNDTLDKDWHSDVEKVVEPVALGTLPDNPTRFHSRQKSRSAVQPAACPSEGLNDSCQVASQEVSASSDIPLACSDTETLLDALGNIPLRSYSAGISKPDGRSDKADHLISLAPPIT